MEAKVLMQAMNDMVHDEKLKDLYLDEEVLTYQKKRYQKALENFISLYGNREIEVYSAPGRSEVGGNHTDHQRGCVLAASINLDAIAIVSKQEGIVKIKSDVFDIKEINIQDLQKRKEEVETSEALVRGVLYRLQELGYQIGGFTAYITSDVLLGAGLSSSACFEVIVGTIISGLYNDMKIDPVEIAKIGQYAENIYFEKPCGLMDQCASSVGGLIEIDFKDIEAPIVKSVDVDFSTFKHSLCIVDAKGSHAELTHEYAAIPEEMGKIAKHFNKEYLRAVPEAQFYENIAVLRQAYGDRAILRAMHFYNDNARIEKLVSALEARDFISFKKIVQESGDSSFKYLQNVYTNTDVHHQSISLALAMSEHILKGHGVSRVHGGGFAGTIQSFVENSYVKTYQKEMEKVFGPDSCHILRVRKYGGIKVF